LEFAENGQGIVTREISRLFDREQGDLSSPSL
jgi:hypothetical protein